jgi:uncharacterized protein (DUF433 family)
VDFAPSPDVQSDSSYPNSSKPQLLRAEDEEIRQSATVKKINRITVDPAVMTGQPCIRGMRVTVANVLRQLAAGHSRKRILEAYPYLQPEDIDACLEYAALLASGRELELAPA